MPLPKTYLCMTARPDQIAGRGDPTDGHWGDLHGEPRVAKGLGAVVLGVGVDGAAARAVAVELGGARQRRDPGGGAIVLISLTWT